MENVVVVKMAVLTDAIQNVVHVLVALISATVGVKENVIRPAPVNVQDALEVVPERAQTIVVAVLVVVKPHVMVVRRLVAVALVV